MILDMCRRCIAWLRRSRAPGTDNRLPTARHTPPQPAPSAPSAAGAGDHGEHRGHHSGFLCREVVLGADGQVAGYQFMLRQATRERARSRVACHAYTEALIGDLLQPGFADAVAPRLIFIDVVDSFLAHPSLLALPPGRTALVLDLLNAPGAPGLADLQQQVRALRKAGLLIGIPDPEIFPELAPLLPDSDLMILRAAGLDPARVSRRRNPLPQPGTGLPLLVRDLATPEHSDYCATLGARFFQGPFVTAREDWQGNHLGPDLGRIAQLLARLREDADNTEVIGLIKQDPAISLRLLRYINAAAGGMSTPVASLDAALQLVGRARLHRWLMILFCSRGSRDNRAAAGLESALVRGRLMELLASDRPTGEQETAFLTGLLSLIDVVLQLPMERALAALAAAPAIEAAVLRGEGSYAALLRLAIACESGERKHLDRCAEDCGVSALTASQHHIEALRWALEVQA